MAGSSGQTALGTNTVYWDKEVTAIGPNYVVASGSSANALTATLTDIAGGSIALAAGLRILLKADTTLQAGANTLTLNSGSAKSIVKQSGGNLQTTTASGALLDLAYDGTKWQLLNSAY